MHIKFFNFNVENKKLGIELTDNFFLKEKGKEVTTDNVDVLKEIITLNYLIFSQHSYIFKCLLSIKKKFKFYKISCV